MIHTLTPASPGGPASPGNPIGPYGQKQSFRKTSNTLHDIYRLTDLTTRARKSHWLKGTKTHKVAFGSVLPRFSSWSWRSSCTRRARVTLLPHIAFSTLGHQHMKCQSMKGEERMKLSGTGQRDGNRVTHSNARLSSWPRVSSFAVLTLVDKEHSVSVRPYLE